MKLWKDGILCSVTLLAAAFAFYCAILFIHSDAFIFGDTAVYYTKEELADLYQRNADILNAAKDSVMTEKIMASMPTRSNGIDVDQTCEEIRALFSDDQLKHIDDVYRKLHPYTMSFELEMAPISYAYHLAFGKQRQETGFQGTSLYWFPSEEDRDRLMRERRINDSAFTHLDDGWYIVQETYHR